jgi:hypothetical protein
VPSAPERFEDIHLQLNQVGIGGGDGRVERYEGSFGLSYAGARSRLRGGTNLAPISSLGRASAPLSV